MLSPIDTNIAPIQQLEAQYYELIALDYTASNKKQRKMVLNLGANDGAKHATFVELKRHLSAAPTGPNSTVMTVAIGDASIPCNMVKDPKLARMTISPAGKTAKTMWAAAMDGVKSFTICAPADGSVGSVRIIPSRSAVGVAVVPTVVRPAAVRGTSNSLRPAKRAAKKTAAKKNKKQRATAAKKLAPTTTTIVVETPTSAPENRKPFKFSVKKANSVAMSDLYTPLDPAIVKADEEERKKDPYHGQRHELVYDIYHNQFFPEWMPILTEAQKNEIRIKEERVNKAAEREAEKRNRYKFWPGIDLKSALGRACEMEIESDADMSVSYDIENNAPNHSLPSTTNTTRRRAAKRPARFSDGVDQQEQPLAKKSRNQVAVETTEEYIFSALDLILLADAASDDDVIMMEI